MTAEVYYRTRDQQVLAKIQSAANTEASPAAGTNDVRVQKPTFSPNFDNIDTAYVQASLSESAPVTGGGNVTMKLPTYLAGSGSAGAAPDFGPLLRACAMSETLLAADKTGTAQAGASSSITLQTSGSSAVDDAYKGMVIETTGGTGSGQRAVITAYNGTTKVATVSPAWGTAPDNTTTYAIRACALYKPVTSGLEFLTVWAYQHRASGNSRLRKMFDAMGTYQVQVAPRGLASLNFDFTGRLSAVPGDVSKPSSPVYQTNFPPPLINANAYLGGAAVKFSEFQFDIANTVQQFDDPTGTYGYDYAQTTMRKPTGKITPNLTLTSSRDAFSDWLASTQRSLWLNWGPAIGNRVSIFLPAIQYTGYGEADVKDFAAEDLSFRSVSPDAEAYICIW